MSPIPPNDVVPSASGTWRYARKLVVAVVGAMLLVMGLVLVLIPGPPGWPLVLGGLGLLATEFVWARSMLRSTRERLQRGQASPQRDDST